MQLATTSKFSTTMIMAPLLEERLHLSAVLITGVQSSTCTISPFHSQIARLTISLKDMMADLLSVKSSQRKARLSGEIWSGKGVTNVTWGEA